MITGDRVVSVRFRIVSRPLKVFFATSLGGKERMTSIIVNVILGDASSGSGECPTSAAFPGETIPAMTALLAELTGEIKGMSIGDWPEKTASFRAKHPFFPMTISGLETALFRAFLSSRGQSEHSYWGGRLREIETDITIPFLPEDPALFRWVEYAVRRGFKIFKVKTSGSADEDMRFLASLFGYLKERAQGFTVRLDGNQGYRAYDFLRMIDRLARLDIEIELYEQPLPKDDFRGLKEIGRHSPVPVILDETIVTGEELKRAIDNGIGGGVNIKVAKSGIGESLNILGIAKEAGLKTMIGCMTETMVGLSAGIFLAMGSGSFNYIDLDGIYFLRHRNRYGRIGIKSPRFLIED